MTSIDELPVFIYNKLTTIFHCLHSDYPRDDVNDFKTQVQPQAANEFKNFASISDP